MKPANLLFDEHGIVRVADFGLARALAEASWTEPAGTVLGTARYAAPEQGSAARLDGRADLYALGLVLVESVTGAVPLVAETPLGTLAVRTDEPIVGAAAARRARRGDRARRSAATPTTATRTRRRWPPRSTTSSACCRRPARSRSRGSARRSRRPAPDPGRQREPEVVFDQDAERKAEAGSAPGRGPAGGPGPAAGDRARSSSALVLDPRRRRRGVRPHPPVDGRHRHGAQPPGHDRGLGPDAGQPVRACSSRSTQRTADDPAGLIVSQSPKPGFFLGRGGTVKLVVSKGPKPVPLPGVVGQAVPGRHRRARAGEVRRRSSSGSSTRRCRRTR